MHFLVFERPCTTHRMQIFRHAQLWRNFYSCRRFHSQKILSLTEIHQKWKNIVIKQQQPKIDTVSDTLVILPMFPYPSGNLHMGHVRVYSISDVLARFYRLKGRKVRHPIGWDAFGLPAENAAFSRGLHPKEWIQSNIANMRHQLENLQISFDWDDGLQLNTSHPSFYKHTQQIFIHLYKRGLAYKQFALVNWDPIDNTVLADEQVDSKGRSWRSGAIVERKLLNQWHFSISKYVDQFLADEVNGHLKDWPAAVREIQRNWIGKQEIGHKYSIAVNNFKFDLIVLSEQDDLTPSSTSLDALILNTSDQNAFQPTEELKSIVKNLDISKISLAKQIVLSDRLSINLVQLKGESPPNYESTMTAIVLNPNNFKNISDLNSFPCISLTTHKIRDWCVSRQRYWGTPIPIIYCPDCGEVPVPEEKLPVLLPENGFIPLAKNEEWKKTTCHKCGNVNATKETDTLDTFVDSSWYWCRFMDIQNESEVVSPSKFNPVDIYIGGVEHSKGHLLFARFIHKVLSDMISNNGEPIKHFVPFKQLITQGMVHGKTFECLNDGKYITEIESKNLPKDSFTIGWEKMSKSKLNGVNPEQLINKYGADAIRLAVLFASPPDMTINWENEMIIGHDRWLKRLLKLFHTQKTTSASKEKDILSIKLAFNTTLARVDNALCSEKMSFNVAIAELMKFSNLIENMPESTKNTKDMQEIFIRFCSMLYPFAPSTAAELYSFCTAGQKLQNMVWPLPFHIQRDSNTVKLPVFYNGKLFDTIELLTNQMSDLPSILKQLKSETSMFNPEDMEVIFKPGLMVALKSKNDDQTQQCQ